jgi:hypothetical protein
MLFFEVFSPHHSPTSAPPPLPTLIFQAKTTPTPATTTAFVTLFVCPKIAKRSSPDTAVYEWRVAARLGKHKSTPESWVKELTLGLEKLKDTARALEGIRSTS